ncbi:inositol monophosphatase family protein [Cryptosporangium phraense]|uniref:inositol monophosphatase family protein n=1 Tax=Cryptosporangium phraense TaxID=2593070 RepID=UPI001478C72F|nr:inositol monophosphatase family protein [Cryptosporangium phraense]
MSLDESRLQELATLAAGVLDEVTPFFISEIGAKEEVVKGIGDWATAADLALERQITSALNDRTGLPVHGEEFGGPDLHTGVTWVLDPIDGTANYTARIPLTGISLALLEDGLPVVGLIRLPLVGESYQAVAGGPLIRNGEAMPTLEPGRVEDVTVTLGNVAPKGTHGGPTPRYPFRYRMAMANAIAHTALRVRMFGSSAVELAWASSGAIGATLNFGNHAWDNAAGALLVERAGGVLRDIEGNPWSLRSTSILVGRPGVVEELVEMIGALGEPATFA